MIRILMVAGIFLPCTISAQQVGKNLTTSAGKFIGFHEYTPPGYSQNTSVKYPLIIFLHGIGERGNGTTELWKAKREGIPKYIDQGNTMTFTWNGKTESFIVLTPQCASNTKWYWDDAIDYVREMIIYAKNNLRIDANRIVLTGFSMGGGGVWKFISSSEANARMLAAASPVCGPCLPNDGSAISNGDLPVWAFHALNDTSASALPECTINPVNNINLHSPKNKALITLYPDGRHYIWDRAYSSDHKYQDPNIFEWFLAQNKSLPANQLPIAVAGADFNIDKLTDKATLSAAHSSDPDGKIVRYTWKKHSGPAGGNLSDPNSQEPIISGFSVPGNYSYVLRVVDDRVGWTYDTITVDVALDHPDDPQQPPPPVNKLPISRAGADIQLASHESSVSLSGISSTDPDGWISSCEWSKVAGPGNYLIERPKNCETRVTGLQRGSYTFRLQVTDDKGSKGVDDVVVSVSNTSLNPGFPGPGGTPARPERPGFILFPVAATHSLWVTYSSDMYGATTIHVYSSTGRLIRKILVQKNNYLLTTRLDVSAFSSGTYFVQVITNGKPQGTRPFVHY